MLEFYNLCCSLFLKTSLDKWISASGPKSKRKPNERELMKPLNEALQAFNATKSPRMLMQVFFRLEKLPDITCYRFEIHESLIRAIHESVQTGLSVYESMKAERNRIRLAGRKNHHRSIGSTLLTKGQEFDHVIVVNQGKKFDLSTETGRKNFYVAISRACKSLTIIDVSEWHRRLKRFARNNHPLVWINNWSSDWSWFRPCRLPQGREYRLLYTSENGA